MISNNPLGLFLSSCKYFLSISSMKIKFRLQPFGNSKFIYKELARPGSTLLHTALTTELCCLYKYFTDLTCMLLLVHIIKHEKILYSAVGGV